jgi:hypothetical protein
MTDYSFHLNSPVKSAYIEVAELNWLACAARGRQYDDRGKPWD